MDMRDMGVCHATVIGKLRTAPAIIKEEEAYLLVETSISALRPIYDNGERKRHENVLRVTASGAAAENVLHNYYEGKRVYVSGELTIYADGPSVHASQLLWLD